MFKTIAVAILGVMLIGCASVQPVLVETQKVDRPKLNTIQTQEIGNTLLEYYVSATMPSIRTLDRIKIQGRFYLPQIPRPAGIGEKVSRFILDEESGDPQKSINACFDPTDSTFFAPNGYGICDFIVKKLSNSGPVRTESAKYIDVRQPQFRQELIYNGKVGNSIKFLYREFYGDLMRAPFSQDVQYDLAEGRVIGFKGARLEVMSSTNRLIEYRVLKSFDR